MIRLSIMLLERVGYDASAVGGPAYCCGTAHDHEPRAASNMAAAPSIGSTRARRGTGALRYHLVPFVPHAYVRHHGARQRHTFRHRSLERDLVRPRAQLTSAMNVPVKRRVLSQAVGFATHVDINSRIVDLLSRISGLELIEGPAHPGHMCSSLAAVPRSRRRCSRRLSAAAENRCDTVCRSFILPSRIGRAGWQDIRIRNWVHLVANME